jgi:hypothetical protein
MVRMGSPVRSAGAPPFAHRETLASSASGPVHCIA